MMVTLFCGWRHSLGGFWGGAQPLPFEPIYGLDVNRVGGVVNLAAATDSAVWVSPDFGDSWQMFTAGLPRRPHCSDVRFGVVHEREALFVSTYGRSVWMAYVDEDK